ncbi:MAG: hypothetical protein ACRC20_06155 [Segniliparus sp.]|uniref:hypothetical protein n=1 Tax=Segniliparus sp. TaxID=2804064 RepID=UPI003F359C5E
MRAVRGLGAVAAIAGVTVGLGLTSQMLAEADPGEEGFHVQCDVYAQGFGPMSMPQYAGTVDGFGENEGAARDDAERKKWGPYGNMPNLQNCRPA